MPILALALVGRVLLVVLGFVLAALGFYLFLFADKYTEWVARRRDISPTEEYVRMVGGFSMIFGVAMALIGLFRSA